MANVSYYAKAYTWETASGNPPPEHKGLPEKLVQKSIDEQKLDTLGLPSTPVNPDVINPENTPNTEFNESSVKRMLKQFEDTGVNRSITNRNYELLKHGLAHKAKLMEYIGSKAKPEYRKDVEFDYIPCSDELALFLTEPKYALMHRQIADALSHIRCPRDVKQRFPIAYGDVPASYFTGRIGKSTTSRWVDDKLRRSGIPSLAVDGSTVTALGNFSKQLPKFTTDGAKEKRLQVSLSCEPNFFLKLGSRLVDSASCYKPGSCNQQAPAYIMGAENSFVVLLKEVLSDGSAVKFPVIARAYGFFTGHSFHISNFYPHDNQEKRSLLRFQMLRGIHKMFGIPMPTLSKDYLTAASTASVRGVSGDGIYCNKDAAVIQIADSKAIAFKYKPTQSVDPKVTSRGSDNNSSCATCSHCGGRRKAQILRIIPCSEVLGFHKKLEFKVLCPSCLKSASTEIQQLAGSEKRVLTYKTSSQFVKAWTDFKAAKKQVQKSYYDPVEIAIKDVISTNITFQFRFEDSKDKKRVTRTRVMAVNALLNEKDLSSYVYSPIDDAVLLKSEAVKLEPKFYGFHCYAIRKDRNLVKITLKDTTIFVEYNLFVYFIDHIRSISFLPVENRSPVYLNYSANMTKKELFSAFDRTTSVSEVRNHILPRIRSSLVTIAAGTYDSQTSNKFYYLPLSVRKNFLSHVVKEYKVRKPPEVTFVAINAYKEIVQLSRTKGFHLLKDPERTLLDDSKLPKVLNIIPTEEEKRPKHTAHYHMNKWIKSIGSLDNARQWIEKNFTSSKLPLLTDDPQTIKPKVTPTQGKKVCL